MVHAGVQLFFVVLTFSVVMCGITGYCLSSKTGAVLAVVTPLCGLSICLQRPFILCL